MFKNNSSPHIKSSLLRILSLVLFFILPLVACPLWGQVVQKKQLTSADYKLWSTLNTDKVSPNEKWVSYKVNYENNVDTLFVKSSSTAITYFFPSGKQSIFTQDNHFASLVNGNLEIVNLETGKKDLITEVTDYRYSSSTNILLIHRMTSDRKNALLLHTTYGKTVKEFFNVSAFTLSPNGQYVSYTVATNDKSSVFLTDLKKLNTPKCLLNAIELSAADFTWHKDSKAVAFYTKSKTDSIRSVFFYTLESDKLSELDPAKQLNFPKGGLITNSSPNKIIISDDLQKLFLTIKEAPIPSSMQTDSNVEIWNTNDKWIYPEEQVYGQFEKVAKVFLWEPNKTRLTKITTNELPSIILGNNHDYALLSNPKAYEPQFYFEGARDYYLMDFNTFEKTLLLTKQSSFYRDLFSSPSGTFISYFKDKNWWIYDIKRKKHINLTRNSVVPFFGKVNALASDSAFGNAGWSMGDTEILLYDEFDIWAFKTDGNAARKLTYGRELKTKYRIADFKDKNYNTTLYDGFLLNTYNLKKELLLHADGFQGQTGYFRWNADSGVTPIFYSDSYVSAIDFGLKKSTIFFVEQKFDLAPRLLSKDKYNEVRTVFQSNTQQKKYHWGEAELIQFHNSKEQNLKGILYYPANYDPQKKYPMIVEIYEIQSPDLHLYSNPTLHNQSGINPSIYTSEGYFYFRPDIIHENENVGPSATDCVVSATKKIIETGMIDPKKIALMGHSFGGYETAFIANHSNLFATAVASGAITDLTSFYLGVGWNMHKPDMWRFGSEQWRLEGKNPFENRIDFDRNSPLESILNLKIPLLMWSGKEDTQVDWRQSIEYYLALRRLEKKSILLLYPKEGHVLSNPTNQQDLTTRLLEWFAYYLKDERSPHWIAKVMQ